MQTRQALLQLIILVLIIREYSNAQSLLTVNPDQLSNDFIEKRFLSVGVWNLGLWSGGWWRSVQTKGNIHEPDFQGDYVWGSVYGGVGVYPVSWLGYFSTYANYNGNVSDFSTFNVSATSGFIASSYLRLIETDPNNVTVAKVNLNDFWWFYSKDTSESLSNKTAGVYAFVFNGTPYNPSYMDKMQLRYFVTEQAGVLDVSNGILIVPKALESVVIISGWNYKNTQNSLSLEIVVGTAQGSWAIDGQLKSHDQLQNKTFFRLSSDVSVDGKIEKAKILQALKVDVTVGFESNQNVIAQLKARYGGSAEAWLLTVQFPPGADEIIYDPSMGTGNSPFDPSSPSTPSPDVSMVVGILVGATVLTLIILVVSVLYYKRSTYELLK